MPVKCRLVLEYDSENQFESRRRRTMKNDELSRRDFMRNTSVVAAGTIVGALAGNTQAAGSVNTSKIMSALAIFNPGTVKNG